MRHFMFWFVFLAFSSQSFAEGCLDKVVDFSNQICGAIEKSGSTTLVNANGELDANISNIIRKVVGGGSGKISGASLVETYENVLREQLGPELKSVRECREKMAPLASQQVCGFQQKGSVVSAQIKDLASFPPATYKIGPPTIFQGHNSNRAAYQLYEILRQYDPDTLSEAPNGKMLLLYRKQYFDYENAEIAFQEQALVQIGKLSPEKMTGYWPVYLNYSETRMMGFSPEQIIQLGSLSNFGIDKDKAEKVYLGFLENVENSQFLKSSIEVSAYLSGQANKILLIYR